MEDSDFIPFGNDAIEFAFSQADKVMEQSVTRFRQVVNYSYASISAAFGLLLYSIDQLKQHPEYAILSILTAISVGFLWVNIKPGELHFSGIQPKDAMNKFFAMKENKDQIRFMQIMKLKSYETGLYSNEKAIAKRHKNLKISALLVFAGFTLTFLASWLH